MTEETNDHYGKKILSDSGYDIIECRACGFAHVMPFPDKKEYSDFYENSFYQDYRSDYIKSHLDDMEWHNIEHHEKYDLFERFLTGKDLRRILDIGSGPGLFLKAGLARGWNTVGVEPGKDAWLYSTSELGLDVHNAFFRKETYKNFGTFNVIHMNNVLEHLLYPKRTLTYAHEILEAGGLVCVTVPNDFNPLQEIIADYFRKEKWWVQVKAHLNYFNRESLSNLVRQAGFEIVHVTSSFPLELFVLMGDDYVGDRETGQIIHARRKNFELAMEKSGNAELRRDMYKKFSELGLGRQITVLGRKNGRREC
ncbi:MAG: class I SAM-dependent methyltransferase [Candidatus Omnitrophota bacterium]